MVRLLESERSCGWVRAPSSGTGLHQLVLPSLKFTRSMYNPFLLSPMRDQDTVATTPVAVLVGGRANWLLWILVAQPGVTKRADFLDGVRG